MPSLCRGSPEHGFSSGDLLLRNVCFKQVFHHLPDAAVSRSRKIFALVRVQTRTLRIAVRGDRPIMSHENLGSIQTWTHERDGCTLMPDGVKTEGPGLPAGALHKVHAPGERLSRKRVVMKKHEHLVHLAGGSHPAANWASWSVPAAFGASASVLFHYPICCRSAWFFLLKVHIAPHQPEEFASDGVHFLIKILGLRDPYYL